MLGSKVYSKKDFADIIDFISANNIVEMLNPKVMNFKDINKQDFFKNVRLNLSTLPFCSGISLFFIFLALLCFKKVQ